MVELGSLMVLDEEMNQAFKFKSVRLRNRSRSSGELPKGGNEFLIDVFDDRIKRYAIMTEDLNKAFKRYGIEAQIHGSLKIFLMTFVEPFGTY